MPPMRCLEMVPQGISASLPRLVLLPITLTACFLHFFQDVDAQQEKMDQYAKGVTNIMHSLVNSMHQQMQNWTMQYKQQTLHT
jgi:hypothetical protein